MLILHRDSSLSEPERRASLLRGEVHLLGPSAQTRALCEAVRSELHRALPEVSDPRTAQHAIPPDELFTRIRRLRLLLASELREPLRELVDSLGCDLSMTYLDAIRLRAVTSGGHRNPAAAAAYYPHRDTWFANPPCQINCWMPLFDTTQAQALGFYPGYFHRAIKNDSTLFDYDEFTLAGGWQAYGDGLQVKQHHPTAQEEIKEAPTQIGTRQDSLLLFAGAHLHAPIPHDTGVTRFSIEFRIFHIEDLLRGAGAPNVDNQSRGSTARDFLRASDFTPLTLRPQM